MRCISTEPAYLDVWYPLKIINTLYKDNYAVSSLRGFHSFLILTYQLIPTEYVISLVLIDIHSQVFMPHGYTDDTPHGYRKSFGLIGKVKSFLLKGWHSFVK